MENWSLTWTKLTELTKSSVQALADNMPGVYRLSYKADDDKYYVYYVGKAEDIKDRLLEHLSSGEKNICIRNYLSGKSCFFRFANVTKSYIRDAAERQMYKHYEPTCNEKEPEGRDDVKVNMS